MTNIDDYRKLKFPAIILSVIIIVYAIIFAVIKKQTKKAIEEDPVDGWESGVAKNAIAGATFHIVCLIFAIYLWYTRFGENTTMNTTSFIVAFVTPELYILYVFIMAGNNYVYSKKKTD